MTLIMLAGEESSKWMSYFAGGVEKYTTARGCLHEKSLPATSVSIAIAIVITAIVNIMVQPHLSCFVRNLKQWLLLQLLLATADTLWTNSPE